MTLKIVETNHKILKVGRRVLIVTPSGPLIYVLDPTGRRNRSICQLRNATINLTYKIEASNDMLIEIEGFLEVNKGPEVSWEPVRFVCS